MRHLPAMKTRLVAMGFAAAAAFGLTIASTPAASAADTYYTWGETTESYYHYNDPSRGEFTATVWVDDLERDSDNDGFTDQEFIRGHVRVCKVSKVLRTQADFVRLGNATRGGVLAETYTKRNSGTAPCAEQVTTWVQVSESSSCPNPFEAWTRGGFSARWSDNRLSSNVSLLSDRSSWDWCALTANRSRC